MQDQISLGGICRTGKCRTNIRKLHQVENAGLENGGPQFTGWNLQDWKMQDQKSQGGICRPGKWRIGKCRTGKWRTWTIKDHLSMIGHVTMHMPSKGEYLRSVCGVCVADMREVCLLAPRSGVALVQCGHSRFCASCADTVTALGNGCPLCRAPINMVLRLFA